MATAVSHSEEKQNTLVQEHQIAAVLENRFGAGLMYVPRNLTHRLLDKATEMGLVDDNGMLTRKGRALIARYV